MENLPEGMKQDRDNVVYFDTELNQFYMIYMANTEDPANPVRIYIPKTL